MADAPEATAAEVQLPEPSIRQQAIDATRAEFEARPEATADGTAPAPDSPEPEVTPEPEQPTADERLSREEVDRLLARQRASMRNELEQARALTEQANLLKELDQLAEEDQDAWQQRVNSDPRAAAAIAERANQVDPTVIARARTDVVMDQARMLFEAVPEIAAIAEEAGDEWAKATNPQTGGIFGYLHRTALEQGKQQGVEDFKKSQEFKKAIEEAERRGAHNALGGIEPPPPSEEGGVVSIPTRKFDDPRQAAMAEAARQLGRRVDPTMISKRRSA